MSSLNRSGWYAGNGRIDGAADRGWIIGYFMAGRSDIRTTSDVEIKWSDHSIDDRQDEWQSSVGSSVSILVSGAMTIEFRDGVAKLEKPSDYVIWSGGVAHRWHAPAAAKVLTVRWPSVRPDS